MNKPKFNKGDKVLVKVGDNRFIQGIIELIGSNGDEIVYMVKNSISGKNIKVKEMYLRHLNMSYSAPYDDDDEEDYGCEDDE